MKRYLTILAAATMLSCGGRQAGYPVAGEDHAVKIASFEEFQSYFRYVPGRDIIISAHRGGMQEGYPENCIASCEKTLSMMPTFFEIDFSFTKDSVMVLSLIHI